MCQATTAHPRRTHAQLIVTKTTPDELLEAAIKEPQKTSEERIHQTPSDTVNRSGKKSKAKTCCQIRSKITQKTLKLSHPTPHASQLAMRDMV